MKQIIDERGNTHYLTDVIGEDGQGTLYGTKNQTIILRDSAGREDDAARFDDVKLLPLSEIENIILPNCYLQKPNLGYLLTIPKNFVPLMSLMSSDKNAYAKTGGFKRRLQICINLAKILMELHSLPAMYGSMSPYRVFISKDAKDSTVYLLYSVKMSYAMNYTPEGDADTYAAPEVKKGRGGTITSDFYAYAALAYDLLTKNETQTVLTDDLQNLFNRAFNQEDMKRPSLNEFYKLFMTTHDCMISCKKCHTCFNYSEPQCPHCSHAKPKMLKASIYDLISQTKIDRGMRILEFITGRQCFWNYHTENVLLHETPKPTIDCVFNISADKKLHFIFKNLMDKEININQKPISPGQMSVVALPTEKIVISYPLHTSTERIIEMVMV